MYHDRTALRLTLPKELALECQSVLEAQGVPVNVTQAVKIILTYGLNQKTKQAAETAGDAINDPRPINQSA
jgi:hypothetical protein